MKKKKDKKRENNLKEIFEEHDKWLDRLGITEEVRNKRNKAEKEAWDLRNFIEKKKIEFSKVSSQLTLEEKLARLQEITDLTEELKAKRIKAGIQKDFELKVQPYHSEEEKEIIERILALEDYIEETRGKHTAGEIKNYMITSDLLYKELEKARERNWERIKQDLAKETERNWERIKQDFAREKREKKKTKREKEEKINIDDIDCVFKIVIDGIEDFEWLNNILNLDFSHASGLQYYQYTYGIKIAKTTKIIKDKKCIIMIWVVHPDSCYYRPTLKIKYYQGAKGIIFIKDNNNMSIDDFQNNIKNLKESPETCIINTREELALELIDSLIEEILAKMDWIKERDNIINLKEKIKIRDDNNE